jgi:hypothetical protein
VAVLVEVYRHALYQAPRAGVEWGAPVHREAVVPHHQVADLPFMGIDELVARRGSLGRMTAFAPKEPFAKGAAYS